MLGVYPELDWLRHGIGVYLTWRKSTQQFPVWLTFWYSHQPHVSSHCSPLCQCLVFSHYSLWHFRWGSQDHIPPAKGGYQGLTFPSSFSCLLGDFVSSVLALLIGLICILDSLQMTKRKPRPQRLLLLSKPWSRDTYFRGHWLRKSAVFLRWGKLGNWKECQKSREGIWRQEQSFARKPSLETGSLNVVIWGEAIVWAQKIYKIKSPQEMLLMHVSHVFQGQTHCFTEGRIPTNARNAGKDLSRIASFFNISGFTLE